MSDNERFLPQTDELANRINAGALDLYRRLHDLDASRLGMPEFCLAYFQSSHSHRLFFSIETSSQLLYRAIGRTRKQPGEIVLMDYGAGVGTLFLLAKLIGCKTVIYNDHLDDWRMSAQLIAEAVGIHIDEFIVGDIEQCLDRLDTLRLRCDLIASRNVLEHIYKLDIFYKSVYAQQPRAIIFSSTTANISNPAAVIKHWRWHRKWEKIYRGKRVNVIGLRAPGLSAARVQKLARATRGLATGDLDDAIEEYRRTGAIPSTFHLATNTCDPDNGVWAEHLIRLEEYRRLIDEEHYEVRFEAGFWDTHYQKKMMNTIGRFFNRVIRRGGITALRWAPFMYVIAIPKPNNR